MWYDSGYGSYLSDEEVFYVEVVDWFIDNKPSILECAENFMISYGRCWDILRNKIKYIDDDKYKQVEYICHHRNQSQRRS